METDRQAFSRFIIHTDIKLSPDGNYIALPTRVNLYLWNVSDGVLIPLNERVEYPAEILFSPDSKYLCYYYAGGNRIFNLAKREFIKLPDESGAPLGFAPSGELVLCNNNDYPLAVTSSGSNDQECRLTIYNLDTKEQRIKKTKNFTKYCSPHTYISVFDVQEDNDILIFLVEPYRYDKSGPITIRYYSIEKDEVVRTVQIPNVNVGKIDLKNFCIEKGRIFAFEDKEVKIIDYKEEKIRSIVYDREIRTSHGDDAPYCVSTDGDWFAVQYPKNGKYNYDSPYEVAIYSTATGEIISKILLKANYKFLPGNQPLINLALDSKKRILAVGTDPKNLRHSKDRLYDQMTIYDIDSKKPIRTFTTVPMNGIE